MPLVKVKPTSAGPPLAGQGRQSATCTRAAGRRAGRERRSAARAATTTATSRCGTRAAATSSTTGSSTSSATRTASPAKVERLEYDPNRSAQLALLLYADGERRYIIAPRGVAVGTRAHVGHRSRDQAGQLPAAAQHPGRHDDPLHRDAAGQGCADRALGRRLACSCSRAKASTRSCACARARSARCTSTAAPSIGEVGNEEHNLRSIGKAGAKRWRGIRPTVRGIAMNPVDHPMGGRTNGGGGRHHPMSPWGTPAKGYKTRKNKRTDTMIVRRRHATKG